jgi:broad specificity phosphatase PhoE
MAELVLLRHGRTAWNHEGRVQGQIDAELDDSGHEQAARAAEVLALLRPTVLWSSDLVRARDTAGYLAARTGLEPTYDARLREYNLGERQGITREEFEAIAPEEFALFRQGYYDDTPGAESTAEVRERMLAALGEVLAALGPTDTGVVVGHGAAIRVAVGALLGWPDDLFRTLGVLGNCGWLTLAPHPLTGVMRLAAYNRTAES